MSFTASVSEDGFIILISEQARLADLNASTEHRSPWYSKGVSMFKNFKIPTSFNTEEKTHEQNDVPDNKQVTKYNSANLFG